LVILSDSYPIDVHLFLKDEQNIEYECGILLNAIQISINNRK